MKLLRKYRMTNYTTLLFVLVVGFILNYYLFRSAIHRTTDDALHEYRNELENYAAAHGTLDLPDTVTTRISVIDVVHNVNGDVPVDESIYDTLVYSHYGKEKVVYRKMNFLIHLEDEDCQVSMILPTLEEDALVYTVLISLVIFIVLFVLFSTVIDRSFTRQIFVPFNRILESMKAYDIENHSVIKLVDTPIDEFRELNRILTGMMAKINNVYDETKEFLEHASHEMKTPLSIIQLKLEVMNQKRLSEEEMVQNLESIQAAVNRMVRYNRSLLFIAKIRNNQFCNDHQINLADALVREVDICEELIAIKGIGVNVERKEDFTWSIHPVLAEHLVQNIVMNAIKHNVQGGQIRIEITASKLLVANTFSGKLPKGNLFVKYNHTAEKKDSNGLGMAIMKSICNSAHLQVDYTTEEEWFVLVVSNYR